MVLQNKGGNDALGITQKMHGPASDPQDSQINGHHQGLGIRKKPHALRDFTKWQLVSPSQLARS